MVGQVRKQTVRVACLVVLSAACLGCIWDSDTLAHEAKGIPNVIAVTTGRFERNPPLYYEMRLGRATRQIAQNSADFAAYDDSGASCDRLGRGDEAIRWMERIAASLHRGYVLLIDYGYTDNDFSLSHSMFNVGIIFPRFNPKKLIR